MRLKNLILGGQKPKSRTETIVYEIVTLDNPIIVISVNKLRKLDSQEVDYKDEKNCPTGRDGTACGKVENGLRRP